MGSIIENQMEKDMDNEMETGTTGYFSYRNHGLAFMLTGLRSLQQYGYLVNNTSLLIPVIQLHLLTANQLKVQLSHALF